MITAAILFMWGLFGNIRSDFISATDQDKWRLPVLFPQVPWWVVAILLVVAFLAVLEGGYRSHTAIVQGLKRKYMRRRKRINRKFMAERATLGQYAKELSDANLEKGKLEDELHSIRLKAEGLEAECESRISEVRLEASIKDAQYKNLRALAERDSQEVGRAVRVEECSIQAMELDSETPHIYFLFTIFNGAIYPIGLETKVGGFIRYGNRRLTGELAMSTKWPVENCPRHYIMRFEVQQWLTKEEAEFIASNLSRPEDRFFDFRQMVVNVCGGSGVTVIEPKPLRFDQFHGIDKNGRLL